MTDRNELLTGALALAERGMYIFPLAPRTKDKPLIKAWQKNATTDAAQIREWYARWPQANIGIVTGLSGLVVPDLDRHADGIDGLDTWDAFCIEHAVDAGTVSATTPSTGAHLYFRAPAGVHIPKKTGWLPGVDIQADRAYVVAPPSVTDAGTYVWNADHKVIAPLPDVMTAMLAAQNNYSVHDDQRTAFVLPSTIPDGTRDDTLYKYACQLRGRGMAAGEIRAAVDVANTERCDPPLPGQAVAKCVASACTHAPGTTRSVSTAGGVVGAIHNSDLGNARRLLALHGKDLRYCKPWKRWLVWDGTRWAEDQVGTVLQRAVDVPKSLYAEAASASGADRRKAISSWAIHSESVGRLRAAVALATHAPGVPVLPDELDADRWLLNVQNGTLDLRTGTLRPHNRADNLTKLAPAAYHADAKCPLWLAFLKRIMGGDQTLIAFLRRAAGYTLTGDTSERVLFLLHGAGANGKTTLLEAIHDAMGDYALRTPTSTLLAKGRDAVPNDVARLKGARFVSASESEDGRAFAEAKIKDLTGNDTVSARFMRAEWFDFKPECKLWLGTNHKPVIRGTDNAIWDRIRLIPFGVRIPEEEQDRQLGEKLTAEREGILAWIVRGCLEWQKNGLGAPDVVKLATAGYRDEMDVLAEFLDDCCIQRADVQVMKRALHASYAEWCKQSGVRPMTKKAVGGRLLERGIAEGKDTTGIRVWFGLGLLTRQGVVSDH